MRRTRGFLTAWSLLFLCAACSHTDGHGLAIDSGGSVITQQFFPVTYRVWARPTSPFGAFGDCFAVGAPVTSPNGSVLLANSQSGSLLESLGAYRSGNIVSVTQEFRQRQFVAINGTSRGYDCSFEFRLYVEVGGSLFEIGAGSCTTTSQNMPFSRVDQRCSVGLTAAVP